MMARLSHLRVTLTSFGLLVLERLCNHGWPAAVVALVFCALSFMNLPLVFGPGLHFVFLSIFTLAMLASLAWLFFMFRLPRRHDIERGIELQNNLPHRPLAALRDRPAEIADAEAYILWARHLERLRKTAMHLRACRPVFTVARQDRYNLRLVAVLLLVTGLVVARQDAPTRLVETLQPDMAQVFPTVPPALDIWIEAPAYTGVMPVFLSSTRNAGAARHDVAMPEGSVLKVRIGGYRWKPSLRLAGKNIALTKAGAAQYTGEAVLPTGGKLSLRPFFGDNRHWNIDILPDRAPQIAIDFTGKNAQGALRLSYRAADDYGLAKITAKIISKDGTQQDSFDIPPAGPATGQNLQTHTEDLTESPMAGSTVTMTLTATDAAGHVAESAPRDVFIPERTFNNPAAVALITERKRLMYYNNPITRRLSVNTIVGIANDPANYKGDPIVFLNLSVAARRLAYDGDEEAVASVQKMLWDVALRIDNGGLSMVARDLAEALQRFSAALNDKTMTEAQLQPLVDDVRQKIQEYTQTLAQELQQRMAQNRDTYTMSPELAAKFMQRIDLNKIMEQMRALAEGGTRQQMQKMANMLRNNVENLDLNRLDQMKAAQREAMQALEEMQKLVEQQQSLMDKTGRLMADDEAQAAAGEQDDLRRDLNGMSEKLGAIMPGVSDTFAKADAEMEQAAAEMRGDNPQAGVPHQKAALDQLQKGMNDTIEKMAREMEQAMMSFGFGGEGSGEYGGDTDPFGRAGTATQSGVKIPEEAERRRVQEIIRELRNRSNDYQRPKVERDYIDRLLNSFN